jgi:3-deoxy-D-manno-octulosonate 8-phosphate phosphatase (KDO 8-P phosphatase)
MTEKFQHITSLFKGNFISDPLTIAQKLKGIKAFLFDWDGVFNNGEKKENGSSSFNEIDAMGTNLLRFNHYLLHKQVPVVTVVTGEKNDFAFHLSEREHFHAVYFKIKNKISALKHFCTQYKLQPGEVAFFFDDVLDLSIPPVAGLRLMIGRPSNPLLLHYVAEKKMADYISVNDGGRHGVREVIELLMGLTGLYNETLDHRIQFGQIYQEYLAQRDKPNPEFFTADSSGIIIKQS